MVTLRKAQSADARMLWLWRNDETTRQNSVQTDIIPWDRHQAWYDSVLADPKRKIFIALTEGDPVGMIRFDGEDNDVFAINILVAPASRGAGFGSAILCAGCQSVYEFSPGAKLRALVRAENIASRRIFESNGFARDVSETCSSMYEYRKTSDT